MHFNPVFRSFHLSVHSFNKYLLVPFLCQGLEINKIMNKIDEVSFPTGLVVQCWRQISRVVTAEW